MVTEIKRIGECAAVLPGFSIKSRVEHEANGTHQIMLAKHLKEGRTYCYHEEDRLRITPAKTADKYQVKHGDVVFISRGIRNSAFFIESLPEPTIASSTLYIIRTDEGIDSKYLAWCINQQSIQMAIQQVRTSAGTPIVQRSNFSDITIPIPSPEKQKRIAGLSDLMFQERMLRQRLFDEMEQYHQLLGRKIMSGM